MTRHALPRATRAALAVATLLAAALALTSSQAFGRTDEVPADPLLSTEAAGGRRVDSLPRDTAAAVGTLPNGMRYYVRSNRTPIGRAELRLVVNAGSVLEDDDQLGLAHFLEHMAFNGTENFEGHEIISFLQSLGMSFGADVNAYTSYDETVYMFTVPTDSANALETGIQILEDWAHRVTIDSAEVVAERGVVLEEWRGRGFSNEAANELRARRDSIYYNGAIYARRMPIGDPERLKTAERAELLRFYEDWYRPDLMAVVAVGDFDRDSMVAAIHRHFAGIEQPASPRPHPRPTIPDNEETAVLVMPGGNGTMISMALKGPPHDRGTLEGFRQDLVQRLYLNMLNRRLRHIARQPDAPFRQAGISSGIAAEGRTTFHELSVVGRRARVRSSFASLLTEVERVAQHGFTAAEIEGEKADLLRELESAVASGETVGSEVYAGQYVDHYLRPAAQLMSSAQSLALVRQLLPGITPAEIAAPAARWRSARNRLILAQVPGLARGVDEEALLAVADSVAGLELEPYTSRVEVAPLMAASPTPGTITGERTIADVGVTEWTLSNGARVLLKPTDFHADQVVIRGTSPGGLSLADDTLFVTALTAASAVRAGGLGDLTLDEVQEALRGKKVRGYQAEIGANSEQVMVDGSPRDLETLFQLLYLQLAEPRIDEVSFDAWKTVARPAYDRAGGGDFLRRYMTLQHPRTRLPSYYMVDSVDMHQALGFYRERFQNAGDFTFVVVGAFTPDEVRPLVERYVASLPTTGRTETARDLQIRPPLGVLEETFNTGSDSKTTTYVNFTGTFDYSRESHHQLGMLAQVLRSRLMERLREELGGIYGVSVVPAAARVPYENYSLQIQFSSAPERAEELSDALFAVLDSLKANGPTPAELREATEIARRQVQRAAQGNDFWLSALSAAEEEDTPIAELLSVDELNRTVTVESVREAARRFLNETNYVHLTFLPRTDVGFDYGSDVP